MFGKTRDDLFSFAEVLARSGSKTVARDIYLSSVEKEGLGIHRETPLVDLWFQDFRFRNERVEELLREQAAAQGAENARLLFEDLYRRQRHLNAYLKLLGAPPIISAPARFDSKTSKLLQGEELSLIEGLGALEHGERQRAITLMAEAAKANAARMAGIYSVLSRQNTVQPNTNAGRLISTGLAPLNPKALAAWQAVIRTRGAVLIKAPGEAGAVEEKSEKAASDLMDESGASPLVHVRRTPHLGLAEDLHLKPKDTLEIPVYLDTKAATKGQLVDDLSITVPENMRTITLDVHLLTSQHLKILSSSNLPLVFDRMEDESKPVTFEVQVLDSEALLAIQDETFDPRRAFVCAAFYYNGRPSGKVTAILSIDLPAHRVQEPPPIEPSGPPTDFFHADVSAHSPEFLVNVIDVEKDGRNFKVMLQSPLLGGSTPWEDWKLATVSKEIVLTHLRNFTTAVKGQRAMVDRLQGAGARFFDAAPEIFKNTLWRLIDEGRPPARITIVSEEPYIPWELMVPHRDKKYREALGVEFVVGRWTTDRNTSAAQTLEFEPGWIIAPAYKGDDALPNTEIEIRYLSDLGVKRIKPAEYEKLREILLDQPLSLLHFAGHGKTDGEDQCLQLEGENIVPGQLLGIAMEDRRPFAGARPLVFLNACEAGQPTRALIGIGGFPHEFALLGAGGVVAPLWAVADRSAHKVATEFYDAIRSEARPSLAEALAAIRRKAYKDPNAKGDDTYAAYCYYGDPLARLK